MNMKLKIEYEYKTLNIQHFPQLKNSRIKSATNKERNGATQRIDISTNLILELHNRIFKEESECKNVCVCHLVNEQNNTRHLKRQRIKAQQKLIFN